MVRNRVKWLAGLCAAFVLMLAMCGIARNFEPLSARARAEREARRYMLTEFEYLGEGEMGDMLFDCGNEVALADDYGSIVSFLPRMDGVALGVASDWLGGSPSYIWLEGFYMYAVAEVPGAAKAEMQVDFSSSDERYSDYMDADGVWRESCRGGRVRMDGQVACFAVRSNYPNGTEGKAIPRAYPESWAFNDLADWPQHFGGVEDLTTRCVITIWYYDASGELIEEIVREIWI